MSRLRSASAVVSRTIGSSRSTRAVPMDPHTALQRAADWRSRWQALDARMLRLIDARTPCACQGTRSSRIGSRREATTAGARAANPLTTTARMQTPAVKETPGSGSPEMASAIEALAAPTTAPAEASPTVCTSTMAMIKPRVAPRARRRPKSFRRIITRPVITIATRRPLIARMSATSPRPNSPSWPWTSMRSSAMVSLVSMVTVLGSVTPSTDWITAATGVTRSGRSAITTRIAISPREPAGVGTMSDGSSMPSQSGNSREPATV